MPAKKSENKVHAKINQNFVINILCKCCDTDKIVSAKKYQDIIDDDELSEKHFKSALGCGLDIYTVKLRRGVTIKFRSK